MNKPFIIQNLKTAPNFVEIVFSYIYIFLTKLCVFGLHLDVMLSCDYLNLNYRELETYVNLTEKSVIESLGSD